MKKETSAFVWTFCRRGGLDQVLLNKDEDFWHLKELDPKLWVALSCPASGLELDSRTLTLLDLDRDGRIRIPEVLEAVHWLCVRLDHPARIVETPESLPLSAIKAGTEEGRRLVSTGRSILENLGKTDTDALTHDDVVIALKNVAKNLFNGDGIIPVSSDLEPEVGQFVQDAVDVVGGVRDAGGEIGINGEIASAFVQLLKDWQAWEKTLNAISSSLGADIPEAWSLFKELEEKIDDYFLRCDLASFAPQTLASLNVDEKIAVPTDHGLLENGPLAELPLSRIEAGRPLDLDSGLNPAWHNRVKRFFTLVGSQLSSPGKLTRENWLEMKKNFAPYAEALALKPVSEKQDVEFLPVFPPGKLGADRIKEILDSEVFETFKRLLEKDLSVPMGSKDIAEVERLVLYSRYLYRLLVNFVSFFDFYSNRRMAAFQAGTLYMDGRSCTLCVRVQDVAKHSVLAAHSQLFLVYCECRRFSDEADGGSVETMTIVAAVTAGDSDLLLESRNGVFVDNKGRDWDATVVKIINNPIGIRQAFLSPYKRFGRMITDQINKLASAKDADLMKKASDEVRAPTASPAAPSGNAAKFDIGKSVGIFAAIGLALGALGTALASILRALFSLQWWQFPLVFLAIFLIVSGPSVVMAWLKLRKRSLGPLLEASGWAVNSWVPINYLLGRNLTSTAKLPDNARRKLADPLKKKRRWPVVVFFLAVLLGAAAAAGWLWYGKLSDSGTNGPASINDSSASETIPAAGGAKPGENEGG